MGGKDSQEFMAVTPARTDLDRWVVLDKSVASFDEIPAEVQEEIKQNCSNGWSLGKIPLPIQVNQPMLRTWKWLPMSTSQATELCLKKKSKRVETPGVNLLMK